MPRKVDLHIHTNKSDGALSPLQIINKALKYNIGTISITDHDTIAAIPEIKDYCEKTGVELVPGIEISTEVNSYEIHLLAYFFDWQNKMLSEYLDFYRNERKERAKRIISRLQDMNVNITIKDVELFSGDSPITRPHIALAMIHKEYAHSIFDAFNNYLGDNEAADVKKKFLSAKEVIGLLHTAGGLVFMAHPVFLENDTLKVLIDAGLDGLETNHPSLKNQKIAYLKEAALYNGLLESGGSDYHGGEKGDEQNFGKYYISQKKFRNIKNCL